MAEVQAGQPNAQPNPDPNANTEAEPKPAPAPKYSQEDMDRITAKVRKNAARDAEIKLRRELGSQPPAQPAQKDEAPKPEEAPKRDAFDNYEEFIEAKATFEGRKAAREERVKADQEAKAQTHREAQEKAAQTWNGRIEAAQAKLPDFETVLEDNEPLVTQIGASPMRGFISQSDIGPQIVYDLCKNKDEVKRILALPAYKQAAEVAKIEDRLLAAAAPKPAGGDEEVPGDDPETEGRERNADGTFKTPPKKETPKGPPEPIEPGSGRSASSSSLPSDKDDPETWRRKELARIRRLQGK